MNIIGTIKFFFRKFLKEADKKHQSIMQIEKAARVFAVQKSSAKLLTSKSLSKQLWIALTLAVPRFSVPNQSSWYEDNATFERFLAGVFEIVADISVFVRFD